MRGRILLGLQRDCMLFNMIYEQAWNQYELELYKFLAGRIRMGPEWAQKET